jgi:Arc/MetJ-type ribon-helix-helix transcriptional regulator
MTLNIELPERVTTFVEQQAKKLGYKDVSEYIAAVLEADHFRKFQEELEEMLLEAIDGPFEEWTDQDVEDIKRIGNRILERRKKR